MKPDEMAQIHRVAFQGRERAWSEREFVECCEATGCILVSLEHGFALGRLTLNEAELLTLAVDPAAQRKGFGRQLLGDFVQIATSQGAATIFLEVAEKNHAAKALYLSSGFDEVGRRKGYFQMQDGTREDGIVLALGN